MILKITLLLVAIFVVVFVLSRYRNTYLFRLLLGFINFSLLVRIATLAVKMFLRR